jgi:succinyl-CoA synthetase beta subunit/citryl-CoA synthetase large subunit
VRRLTEDETKEILKAAGLPVPTGEAVSSAAAARTAAARFESGSVLKALVPTGRRGKAGAVHMIDAPDDAAAATEKLLGQIIHDFQVDQVYIEERVAIADEFYLSFAIESYPPKLLISRQGGVDIEDTFRTNPEAVVMKDIDPLVGVTADAATEYWREAGVADEHLRKLGDVTKTLYEVFRDQGALTLELNPVAIDGNGDVQLVGTMMALEDPMFLHTDSGGMVSLGRKLNERERRVAEANINLPGGMMRYTELDGDIGLYVGGGGMGVIEHDLMLAEGGRPANHTDSSTVNADKVRVLAEAILDNPNVRGLLVSWHFQQMGRIDRRVIPVAELLTERNVDLKKFPVVIRMFGPGEPDARKVCEDLPGIHYLPHATPVEDAVRLIIKLTSELDQGAAS